MSKKNQTNQNWKTIIESNSIDTNNLNQHNQSANRWNKMSKVNYKNDLNAHYNSNNKNVNYVHQNNHLNKRKFEGITTSGSAEPHNSVMTQLHHLQKLLTKLLTRKSSKKPRSEKSLKLFNETDGQQQSRRATDIETNEIEDNEDNGQDEYLANNIVEKLLLTDTGIKNLVFDWVISDWSSCSVSHGTGFQVFCEQQKMFLSCFFYN